MTDETSIGVLICSWAGGKDGAFDLQALKDHAARSPLVTFVAIVDRICSSSGQSEAVELLKRHKVDRFVVAACSPGSKEPMYRRISSLAGLHPLGFESANLREQCAYVHDSPHAAEKAKVLIDMAIAKADLWVPPPYEDELPVTRRAAIIGDGLAAGIAAYELAMQGIDVDLIMRSEGFEWPADYLFENRVAQHRAEQTMMALAIHPRVNLVQAAEVVGFDGVPGSFGLMVERYGDILPIKCGAVVLAPHLEVKFKVLRGTQLGALLSSDLQDGKRVVILPGATGSGVGCNCVSARAVRFAQTVKERSRDSQVMLMGREMRALGSCESIYEEAQRQGIIFTRIEQVPVLEGESPCTLKVMDASLGELAVKADTVVMETSDAPQLPSLSRLFGVPMDQKGDFLTLETRLRSTETMQRGVFACRVRMGNMMAEDLMLEAKSAASFAAELLTKGTMEVGGAVAEVEPEKCSACLACVRICPYGAPVIGEAGKAQIVMQKCQGCGICVGLCPSKAIAMYGSSDAQLRAQASVALQGVR